MKPVAIIRNPLLALPASKRLQGLPIESRAAIADLLLELSVQAEANAQHSWRKSKGPMAAYWKAVAVYAKHARRLVRAPF